MSYLLTSEEDLRMYALWVQTHAEGSLWQSLEWKCYQEALGRKTRIYALRENGQILASALVVIDRTVGGFTTWDIPRGPLWDIGLRTEDKGTFMEHIVEEARTRRCLSLYLSPLTSLPSPKSQFLSPRQEQPSSTRLIDLTLTKEEILKQMKPKGRYNIAVAAKNGVIVEESKDIDAFVRLLKETGQRDKFTIHSKGHYETFLRELKGSFLLLASRGGEAPIAGLLGVIWNSKAYYYYGASNYAHRALMAPYALQWAALRHCKAAGCLTYDLLGIAPESASNSADHPWAGVSAFKEKFGGAVVNYLPEQEIVLRPTLKRLLQLKRRMFG